MVQAGEQMTERTLQPSGTEQQPPRAAVYPFVSVIIPVRNAPERLRRCLDAVLQQTYPRERYEIIVVDNGSSDDTPRVIQSYPVTMLVETSMVSPYPARNTGIRHAQGTIIALLDANVTPTPHWLEQGVQALEREAADLAGGHITFTFSPQKTAAEMVDSIMYVDVKYAVQRKKTTMCTNLFVRKAVFDAIGLFPDTIRSGGDTIWTGRATHRGYSLVYAAEAEGLYPARKMLPLLKKSYRLGHGFLAKAIEEDLRLHNVLYVLIVTNLPVSISYIKTRIIARGTADMLDNVLSIWLIYWLCNVGRNLGLAHALLLRIAGAVHRRAAHTRQSGEQ
jgi:glycosyltransferase involved in cell wall biosynthesis